MLVVHLTHLFPTTSHTHPLSPSRTHHSSLFFFSVPFHQSTGFLPPAPDRDKLLCLALEPQATRDRFQPRVLVRSTYLYLPVRGPRLASCSRSSISDRWRASMTAASLKPPSIFMSVTSDLNGPHLCRYLSTYLQSPYLTRPAVAAFSHHHYKQNTRQQESPALPSTIEKRSSTRLMTSTLQSTVWQVKAMKEISNPFPPPFPCLSF